MIFNPNVMAAAGGGGGAVVGTYTGDGTKSREIDLPFAPALLIVEQTSGTTQYIAFITGEYCKIFKVNAGASLFTVQGRAVSLPTSIDNKIFEITRDTYDLLNSKDDAYIYIAIPKA